MGKILFFFVVISTPVSNHEKIISAIGEILWIYCKILVSTLYVGAEKVVCVLTSIGASAILLFSVPYSTLVQHWNVIGDHLISTTINVVSFQRMPSGGISAGASVGFTIGAIIILEV